MCKNKGATNVAPLFEYIPNPLLNPHIRDFRAVIIALVELLAHLSECVQRVVDVIHGVRSRRDDAEDNHALGNDGIGDDRAEDLVVLAQVHRDIGGLHHVTLHMHRRHASLCRTDVEAQVAEALLQGAGHLPQLGTQSVTLGAADDFETLLAAFANGKLLAYICERML